MPEPDFYPQTAREGLLEIRRLIAQPGGDRSRAALGAALDRVAELSLERREPINFEMSDELGDRLAEAHKVLREAADVPGDEPMPASIADAANEALTLPPQLEAVVERRIGPRS